MRNFSFLLLHFYYLFKRCMMELYTSLLVISRNIWIDHLSLWMCIELKIGMFWYEFIKTLIDHKFNMFISLRVESTRLRSWKLQNRNRPVDISDGIIESIRRDKSISNNRLWEECRIWCLKNSFEFLISHIRFDSIAYMIELIITHIDLIRCKMNEDCLQKSIWTTKYFSYTCHKNENYFVR